MSDGVVEATCWWQVYGVMSTLMTLLGCHIRASLAVQVLCYCSIISSLISNQPGTSPMVCTESFKLLKFSIKEKWLYINKTMTSSLYLLVMPYSVKLCLMLLLNYNLYNCQTLKSFTNKYLFLRLWEPVCLDFRKAFL